MKTIFSVENMILAGLRIRVPILFIDIDKGTTIPSYLWTEFPYVQVTAFLAAGGVGKGVEVETVVSIPAAHNPCALLIDTHSRIQSVLQYL
jgi:hypothetical protein